ncbi:hypothetical protein NA56DRAFT_754098 [Hyaloscypha hepaticicola]|uniref:Uncharacterized protein n=1 Tax=Hyaloscypha hepaticicola TaxID=2082293 RepID=A0A2J6PMV1_9HELO|nr:hypothetical protein NA56DRAFT_754098 [Hyaloscypha hepaticicola]
MTVDSALAMPLCVTTWQIKKMPHDDVAGFCLATLQVDCAPAAAAFQADLYVRGGSRLDSWSSGSSILQSEISTAPLFEHRHTTLPVDAATAIYLPFVRAATPGMEEGGNPFQVRSGQGGGTAIADPLTISRLTVTLSDTWVGRASGKVQTDPEPFNIGTL